MQKYKRVYLSYFNYGEQDYVPSEYSGLPAEDIHHLTFRSQGGKDEVENLMALTREEHDRAHSDREFNERLKKIHLKRLQTL